jgi:hypothetical protein
MESSGEFLRGSRAPEFRIGALDAEVAPNPAPRKDEIGFRRLPMSRRRRRQRTHGRAGAGSADSFTGAVIAMTGLWSGSKLAFTDNRLTAA